jgi:hypothetical protein
MNLPGNNELSLTDEAIRMAIEDAINASQREGEDFIRVVSLRHTYTRPSWIATITTDAAEAAEPAALKEVA